MSDQNIEANVLKANTDKLCTGLRQARRTLSDKLYAKGLLAEEIYRDESDTTMASTMHALQDRVQLDSDAYYTFKETLTETSGVEYLADILETDRKAMVEKCQEEKRKSEKAENDQRREDKARTVEGDCRVPSQIKSFDSEMPEAFPETERSHDSTTSEERDVVQQQLFRVPQDPMDFRTETEGFKDQVSYSLSEELSLSAESPGEVLKDVASKTRHAKFVLDDSHPRLHSDQQENKVPNELPAPRSSFTKGKHGHYHAGICEAVSDGYERDKRSASSNNGIGSSKTSTDNTSLTRSCSINSGESYWSACSETNPSKTLSRSASTDLDNQETTKCSNCEAFKRQVEDLKQEKGSLEDKHNSQLAEIERLKNENKEIHEVIAEHRAKEASLNKQLRSKNDENKSLNSKIQVLKRDLSTEMAEKKEEQNEKIEMGEELNSERAKKEKARADKDAERKKRRSLELKLTDCITPSSQERSSPASVTPQPIQESTQNNPAVNIWNQNKTDYASTQ